MTNPRHDVKRDAEGLESTALLADFFGALAEQANEAEKAAEQHSDAGILRRWAEFLRTIAPDVPRS